MMKKIIFFLFFVPFLSLNAQEVESYDWIIGTKNTAPVSNTETVVSDSTKTNQQEASNQFRSELIILGGGGYNEVSQINWADYGFAEARWMFGRSLRIGPYVSYVAFNGEELYKNPVGQFIGREISVGASLDSYGAFNLRNSYYTWLTGSYRDSKDYYQENFFTSETKTQGVGIFFGFFVTNNRRDWFGNHKIMLSGFIPTKAEVTGTWKGEEIDNLEPYNKQQFRGTYEIGLKRFGNKVDFEPLLHTGYGYQWGKDRKFYEVGLGFDFGIFNAWYHEVLKVKAFWRQDLSAAQLSGWQTEFTLNLSQLVQSLKK